MMDLLRLAAFLLSHFSHGCRNEDYDYVSIRYGDYDGDPATYAGQMDILHLGSLDSKALVNTGGDAYGHDFLVYRYGHVCVQGVKVHF